jgi:seryl-tRNA synthetase
MCFLPPDGTSVAVALDFQNVGAMDMDFQKWYLEWPAKHQFCDCSVCSCCLGQWQGPKKKARHKIKEKRGAQEGHMCHLEGGTVHMARVKGISLNS